MLDMSSPGPLHPRPDPRRTADDVLLRDHARSHLESGRGLPRLPFRAEIEANTVVSHVGQYAMHLPDLVKVPVVLELIKGQQRRGVIVFA